jgi:hypothetical protein
VAESQCIGCSQPTKQFASGKYAKWCSKPCRDSRKRQRIRANTGNKPRGPYSCLSCGKQYITTRPKGEGEKCCSRECGFKLYEIRAEKKRITKLICGPYIKIDRADCPVCREPFWSHGAQRTCSRSCGSKLFWLEKSRARPPSTCVQCGAVYCSIYGAGKNKTCSAECQAENQRESKRAAKANRRARKRMVPREWVQPVEIFMRDAWTCQGCGCHTPEQLRGTHDDSAPELDHIVALAVGGSHTRSNLQTLCRLCNQIKSDKPMSELRLYINDIQGAGSTVQTG